MQPYRDAHADVGTGPQARGPALLQVDAETDPDAWLVRQVLDDPDGDHDWAITARVDLAASDALGEPAVEVLELTAL
ncbi:hypothetical protein GCM10025868_44200 [Angustibacter aerolatus]|uniref:Uncharacterized protein n=1 Tax=Angustibacter aerolatus TaxID=1162965 RepID=A0ABQ6JR50_9ACTN|nr:hypothetical protein GCM10025868_44200 [Angustibacter aerolatus]